jgi:acetyltransferase-like isoleucine patch superfamily enzyme
MPLNRGHAFAQGPTFGRPRPALVPGPVFWLAERLSLLWARLATERVWWQFDRHAILEAGCRLGPAAWCVNAGPRERITLREAVVCRGLLVREAFGDGCIRVGDHVYIGDDVLVSCAASVTIGRFTLVAHGAQILDNDSHPTDPGAREAHYRAILAGGPVPAPPVGAAPITIGERAWIGLNAFVGKGVTIGDESIVAAGSVVTRDVPPRTLVAGNPAQAVKSF